MPDPSIPDIEAEKLQVERDRLALERDRLVFEKQNRSSSPIPAIAAIVSIAAVLVSGANVFLAKKQDEREYRLKAVTFLIEKGDKIFSPDSVQQSRNRAIIALFPKDMKVIIVKALDVSAPDTTSKKVWSQIDLQIQFQSMLDHHKRLGGGATLGEAKGMLRRLGARTLTREAADYVSGLVSDSTEVTIWVRTYNKPSCYGVRFGSPDGSYFGSNGTYFEVCK